jgi:hypothetical protein
MTIRQAGVPHENRIEAFGQHAPILLLPSQGQAQLLLRQPQAAANWDRKLRRRSSLKLYLSVAFNWRTGGRS